MMWDDIGFLLSKNRYNENSLISEIYTKDHGKISGNISLNSGISWALAAPRPPHAFPKVLGPKNNS